MIRVGVFILVILSGFMSASANRLDDRVMMVYGMLLKFHYSPRPLDDSLSADIYSNFLKSIDPDHLYFTRQDVNALGAYRFSIDDQLKSGEIILLHRAIDILRGRMKSTDSLVSVILSKPLDYNENETFNDEKDTYPADIGAWNLKIRKYLKLKMLVRLSKYERDSLNDPKKFENYERVLRGKVLATEHRAIISVLDNPEGYQEYICSEFCNTLTMSFDPHSSFFSPNEKENFISEVSTEANSFGIIIKKNKEDELYISKLIPGGAAWKSGQLHTDDVLMSIKWADETVDLNGSNIEEINSILSSIGEQAVEFTVRTKSGVKITVTLKKEKITSDKNIVKSFILKGDKTTIGYIQLPSFYADNDSKEGSNCANDVGKELIKLSKENIDGLILDLRYNGGGSLEEALQLAGIFINEGALCFQRDKDEKPYILRDPNRGTMYDGPMLVMVNGMTASASEIVASSLQDYNRAVVAGARTYGKATAQVVLPVDTTLNKLNLESKMKNKPEFGFIKVTVEKLYRCTGKTNQFLGTSPDIELPDLYSMLKFREETRKNAIRPDTIKKATYFHPYTPLPVGFLRDKSNTRIAGNAGFKKVQTVAKELADLENDNNFVFPLKLDEFLAFEKKLNAGFADFRHAGIDSGQTIFKVKTLSEDNSLLRTDEIKNQDYNQVLQEISSDIYIGEGFQILNDLVNIHK
jgi:carboxyl-terminal processing protease